MTEDQGQSTTVPMDSVIEQALDDGDTRSTFESLYAEREDWTRVALARQVKRLDGRIDELQRERQAVIDDYDHAIEAQVARLSEVDSMLADIARLRRKDKRGNYFDVPGVGRWSTRSGKARFQTDNAAVLAWLEETDADAFQQFSEEPPPPPRRLLGDEFRKHLVAQLPEDDDQVATVGEALAAAYPGVEFHPPEIGVSYKLDAPTPVPAADGEGED